MNQQQKKFLRSELSEVARIHSRAIYTEKEKTPAAVKRARSLVAQFEKQQRLRDEARRNAMHAAESAAEKALHFGTPEEAMAAIEKFRKQSF
jgi:hypothetical protein